MSLFLAISSLQGRPMSWAAEELLSLEPDGLQLTPGNVPTVDFINQLKTDGVPTMTHHGFCEVAYRQPVWDGVALLVPSDSVHPPRRDSVDPDEWFDANLRGDHGTTTMEVMFGDELLGNADEVDRAMDQGMPLAVDVSHVFIQLSQGQMGSRTWERLASYDNIQEIHLSQNDGVSDLHQQLTTEAFGFDWAVDRIKDLPVVVESYLHKLDEGERREMLTPLRRASK